MTLLPVAVGSTKLCAVCSLLSKPLALMRHRMSYAHPFLLAIAPSNTRHLWWQTDGRVRQPPAMACWQVTAASRPRRSLSWAASVLLLHSTPLPSTPTCLPTTQVGAAAVPGRSHAAAGHCLPFWGLLPSMSDWTCLAQQHMLCSLPAISLTRPTLVSLFPS